MTFYKVQRGAFVVYWNMKADTKGRGVAVLKSQIVQNKTLNRDMLFDFWDCDWRHSSSSVLCFIVDNPLYNRMTVFTRYVSVVKS